MSEHVIKFKRKFAEAKQALENACKTSDLELIKNQLVQFLSLADDEEFYMSPNELEVECACITPTIDRAVERRRELGENLVDLLTWGYRQDVVEAICMKTIAITASDI